MLQWKSLGIGSALMILSGSMSQFGFLDDELKIEKCQTLGFSVSVSVGRHGEEEEELA